MGFELGRITRLWLNGAPLYTEEHVMALSERRFDARIAALEAITRAAKGDEDRAILLENAEQIEEWLMRDGPVEEEEPRLVGWIDETRGWRPPWGRGA